MGLLRMSAILLILCMLGRNILLCYYMLLLLLQGLYKVIIYIEILVLSIMLIV